MEIETLLPKKLDKSDASYKAVEELDKILKVAEQKDIRNIALTGPYGSGKSSVLLALKEDFKDENRVYLPISLATLQANGETTSDTDGEENEDIENLNRKIEYSILQQLIYREKSETIPHSRFRRIISYSQKQLRWKSIFAVITILCFFVVFEPRWAQISSISELLNFSKYNVYGDLLCSTWLVYAMYRFCRYILKSYSNSKLNKLNLKDGEIEVVEDNSIFNKHLDEILYFFEETTYNVVIIEDLDRFGTPKIFLKLRELNQLLNESKSVSRHITFIYAIKDDIFKDEERTKFFDYITTIIPVINPSNSKDILKNSLIKQGYSADDIPDADLSEMAFFIQDMRILTNIVNEYKQYRDKLCAHNGQKLNYTKLLGMIVYKNYYPQDFAQLHRREGKVYSCISQKRIFVDMAIKTIEKAEKEIKEQEEQSAKNTHMSISDLRLLFLYKIQSMCNNYFESFCIDGQYYNAESIANNDELFSKILKADCISYQYYNTSRYYSNPNNASINIKNIKTEFNICNRLEAVKHDKKYFEEQYKAVRKSKREVRSLKLCTIFSKYDLQNTEDYQKLALPDMLSLFIKRGYIDEDYYDYISYFYEGMVSQSDRTLLLNIKLHRKNPYDYHIDKVDNFVKEIRMDMFEHDAILNNDLLDYLASHTSISDFFNLFMDRLERKDLCPLDFLSQYYLDGKQQSVVFDHFIQWNSSKVWELIRNWSNNEERDILTVAYLQYCKELNDEQVLWLNNEYAFLINHIEDIGLEKVLMISSNCLFESINADDTDVLDCVIEHDAYSLNEGNLHTLFEYLCSTKINVSQLNYTRIKSTQNENVIQYAEKNIQQMMSCLKDSAKDEDVDSLLFIINNENLTKQFKLEYLKGQKNKIESIIDIKDKDNYVVAISDNIVAPTWGNLVDYFNSLQQKLDNEIITFIDNEKECLIGSLPDAEKSEESYSLIAHLICSNALPINTYKRLIEATSLSLDESDPILQLDKDRLLLVINKGLLPFEDEMITIVKSTKAFAEYLIYHHVDFMQNIENKYEFDADTVMKLFRSSVFSYSEKRKIVHKLSEDILSQPYLANDLSQILVKTKDVVGIKNEIILGIIQNAKLVDDRVYLAIMFMEVNDNEEDSVSEALTILGDSYGEIKDKSKRALLVKNDINKELLEYLKRIGYISTFKEETSNKNKGNYRVYHKFK